MSTRQRFSLLVTVAVFTAAAVFGWHHYQQIRTGPFTSFQLVVVAAYVTLVFMAVAPHLHRDVRVDRPRAQAELDAMSILTIVPAHNEDPDMFWAMLRSVAAQTRLPNWLHIVENGGPGYQPTLGGIVERFRREECPAGMHVRYDFNPVAGKREAQAIAIRAFPTADLIMTLDSDVELGAADAIEVAIAPFAPHGSWHRLGRRPRRDVASVCGFLVGKNWSRNLWTILVDLSFINSFLNGRASYGMLGSVAVNTGGLAFYRGTVVRKYLDHYLGHRIFGRQMQYGDDAMLTRYSMLEGRTLFQRGAWGYTLHPERRSHLAKQRVRWHRSWFWGNLWLIRTFSPLRPIWALTLWQFLSFVWFTGVIPYVLVLNPALTHQFGWGFFGWMSFVAYLSSAQYLTVKRPDMTFRQQLLVWLLAPASAVLNLYIGFALKYVGLFTCLKTGWSTRQTVEVGLSDGPGGAAGAPLAGLVSMFDETVELPRITG